MMLKASMYAAIALMASASAQASSPVQAAGESPETVCATATADTDPGNFNYCVARDLWLQGKYARAEPKLVRAAELGSKPAQYLLGIAYFNGDGLTTDKPKGLAWLALSSDGTDRADYLGTFKSAYEQTSDEEHAKAEKVLKRLQEPNRNYIARSYASSSGLLRCGQTTTDVQLIGGCPGPTPFHSERMGPAPTIAVSSPPPRGR
jgi:TPR repeat protein